MNPTTYTALRDTVKDDAKRAELIKQKIAALVATTK